MDPLFRSKENQSSSWKGELSSNGDLNKDVLEIPKENPALPRRENAFLQKKPVPKFIDSQFLKEKVSNDVNKIET